jgi:hypothetical protein
VGFVFSFSRWCFLACGSARRMESAPALRSAVTQNDHQTGSFTFSRDNLAGPLTLLANSASTFTQNCIPTAIDPRGRFLYSPCGDGVAMYTLDCVAVANRSASSSSVTVSTSGKSAIVPSAPSLPKDPGPWLRRVSTFLATILLRLVLEVLPSRQVLGMRARLRFSAFAALVLAIGLNGCGSGSPGTPPPPAAIVTPAGTYTITVTPTATPSGSTKQFPLIPLQLTLTVK